MDYILVHELKKKKAAEQRTTATHAHMGPVRHNLPRDYPLPGRRRGPTPPATHLITLRVRARALVVAGLHHLLLVVGSSS